MRPSCSKIGIVGKHFCVYSTCRCDLPMTKMEIKPFLQSKIIEILKILRVLHTQFSLTYQWPLGEAPAEIRPSCSQPSPVTSWARRSGLPCWDALPMSIPSGSASWSSACHGGYPRWKEQLKCQRSKDQFGNSERCKFVNRISRF